MNYPSKSLRKEFYVFLCFSLLANKKNENASLFSIKINSRNEKENRPKAVHVKRFQRCGRRLERPHIHQAHQASF